MFRPNVINWRCRERLRVYCLLSLLSPSEEEAFFNDKNDPNKEAGNNVAQDVTKGSAKDADARTVAPDVTTIPEEEKDDPLGVTKYEDSLNLSVIQVDKTPESTDKPFDCTQCDRRIN